MGRKGERKPTGNTPAIRVLREARVPHVVHSYDPERAGPGRSTDHQSGQYGQQAAEALDVSTDRIAKTLIVEIMPGNHVAVAIVPVSRNVDLKACAAAVGGKKARLARSEVAERSSGYVVGGISPIGQRTPLPTVVDNSITRFDTVYVSAGQRGLQVELAPPDLLELTGAKLTTIASTD